MMTQSAFQQNRGLTSLPGVTVSAAQRHAALQHPVQLIAVQTSFSAVVDIIDDDAADQRLLISLLSAQGWETRSHTDFGSFLAHKSALRVPRCLIVDIEQAPLFEAWHPEGRSFLSEVPTLITGRKASVWSAVQAIKAGAFDFLEKPLQELPVLMAVEAALETDRLRHGARREREELLSRYEALTRREREVMALVATGRMNKQVAGDLGLSEITVKVHRGSAMRKMGARTLADLVRMTDALAVLVRSYPEESGGPQLSSPFKRVWSAPRASWGHERHPDAMPLSACA